MQSTIVNRRARFDYDILEEYETGIELLGFEVKSVRVGKMSLAGAFVLIRGNEAWLLNATIPPYQPKNTPKDYNQERTRRLLLKREEIRELIGKTSAKGLTIVPINVYSKRDRIKLLIGLARHKKQKDQRETIKRRETEREIRRTVQRG